MTNQPDKPTRRRWPWALLALAALYPLSLGPALLIADWIAYFIGAEIWEAERLVGRAYLPIRWAMNRSEIVEQIVNMYLDALEPLLPPF